jgi:hypothetical protein
MPRLHAVRLAQTVTAVFVSPGGRALKAAAVCISQCKGNPWISERQWQDGNYIHGQI